jgi:hypothetical protein
VKALEIGTIYGGGEGGEDIWKWRWSRQEVED